MNDETEAKGRFLGFTRAEWGFWAGWMGANAAGGVTCLVGVVILLIVLYLLQFGGYRPHMESHRIGSWVVVGAVAGAIFGAAQSLVLWLMLWKRLRQAGWWVLASTLGWVVGLVVADAIVENDGPLGWDESWLPVFVSVCLSLVGLAQWLVLRKQVRRSGWWVLANIVGTAGGWLVGWTVARGVRYWILGAPDEVVGWVSGAIVFWAITGLVMTWLRRPPSARRAFPWKWVAGMGAVVVVTAVLAALLSFGLSGGFVRLAQLATARKVFPAPTTQIREIDGAVMVYVPAGEFWMGSHRVDSVTAYHEMPFHKIHVDAFWIDRTEVTNAQYRKCVDLGACTPPERARSETRESYYGDPEYDDYPVIYVSWHQAREYSEWVGGRLPTEAEWEYAARGPDGDVYPWGNGKPNLSLLNYDKNVGDTTAVGSYPDGASWCGALDMSGNVWEWTSSLYEEYPYDPDDGRENEEGRGRRVVRGGAHSETSIGVRCALRSGYIPGHKHVTYGFRVARSAP